MRLSCQRRCDFVVFRRTGNVEKWRVKVYSLCIIILAVFARQAQDKLINQGLTGFKPASETVYKGCIHHYADRRKMTFCFGENRHFQVGVDNPTWRNGARDILIYLFLPPLMSFASALIADSGLFGFSLGLSALWLLPTSWAMLT